MNVCIYVCRCIYRLISSEHQHLTTSISPPPSHHQHLTTSISPPPYSPPPPFFQPPFNRSPNPLSPPKLQHTPQPSHLHHHRHRHPKQIPHPGHQHRTGPKTHARSQGHDIPLPHSNPHHPIRCFFRQLITSHQRSRFIECLDPALIRMFFDGFMEGEELVGGDDVAEHYDGAGEEEGMWMREGDGEIVDGYPG